MSKWAGLAACLLLAMALPAHVSAAGLPMSVSVQPNPLTADTSSEAVQVVTQPRIICVAFVLYDDGSEPVSFEHAQTKVTSYSGVAVWRWHDRSLAPGGTASVSCNNGPTTRTMNLHFRILPTARSRALQFERAATMPPFTVRAAVSPNPIGRGSDFATLTAYTTNGAHCAAGIFYNDGRVPRLFSGIPRSAAHGAAVWIWRDERQSNGGTATVTCMYAGKTMTATAVFTIIPRT